MLMVGAVADSGLRRPRADFTPSSLYNNMAAPMTIYANAPSPTIFEIWLKRSVTPEELSGPRSGHQVPCFRIRMEYKDAFSETRWQEFGFCVRSAGMEYLPKYNDFN